MNTFQSSVTAQVNELKRFTHLFPESLAMTLYEILLIPLLKGNHREKTVHSAMCCWECVESIKRQF